jgi:hypothetical protein
MQNHSKVVKGIGGFISFWESLSAEDNIGEYWRSHEHLIHYWKKKEIGYVVGSLVSRSLKSGFWPQTRITSILEDIFMDNH